MNTEKLRVLADMTVRLTELRQRHCQHLCVENFAPQILRNLMDAFCDSELSDCRVKLAEAYVKLSGKNIHASDCATSCAPAMTPGPCDCYV